MLDGSGNLQVPRDELRHAFVLLPLAEIAPAVCVPGDGRRLDVLWQQHPDRGTAYEVMALDFAPD